MKRIEVGVHLVPSAWLVKSRVNLERIVKLLGACHLLFRILRSNSSLKFCAYKSERGPSYPLSFSDFSAMTVCGCSPTLSNHVQNMGWRQGGKLGSEFLCIEDLSAKATKLRILYLSTREKFLRDPRSCTGDLQKWRFIARNLG